MDASIRYGPPPIGPANDPEVSPHGQAALLLTESLLHCLVQKGVITREDFIDIVEGAAEVEHELLIAKASSPADDHGSLLNPLASAFRRELGR